jgi:asparagine synthase (glutamine-hydrolysing)
VALLMRHGYIPAPHSIYANMCKLPPGELLTLDWEDLTRQRWPAPRVYWSARECAESGLADPFAGSDVEAANALEGVLRESVRSQMVADVPVGAFLSGGIDSSTIVALMQAASSRPIKTFSIGFVDEGFNEAHHAKAIARHVGTDHTELYVTADEAMAVIPSLPVLYDEPFADSSQIPTYLVAHLARRHVTVSLSGDGGDELFFGYPRYEATLRLWRNVDWMPAPVRESLAALIAATPSSLLNLLVALYGWSNGRVIGRRPTRTQWRSFARTLEDPCGHAFYCALGSHWPETSALVSGSSEIFNERTHGSGPPELSEFCERMMYFDTIGYLPDDILVKVDRAAMAVSLETRIPMLDHRVVELAWRMPLHLKRRNGQGKWLLRQVLYRYVPRELVERPKMGFGVPLNAWLRGSLRDWADSLLAQSRLEQEGYFNAGLVRQKWAEHLSVKYDHSALLWDVLMFQSWLESSHASSSRATEAVAC